jgi:hypothetical protein
VVRRGGVKGRAGGRGQVNDHLHAGMTALYNISGQTNRSLALGGELALLPLISYG